jgi:two-component system chemotaxis response regulator CheV
VAQADNKRGILLESGTNELEILVFSLGPTRYGVNVAKVREVIGHVDAVDVPMTNPAVIGVFTLREAVVPLVDLQLYFDPDKASEATQRTVILMEFNDVQIGFLVDKVDRIFHLSWDEMRPMPTVQSDRHSVITSVCELDGELVLMIDFEIIAFDINGEENVFQVSQGLRDDPLVERQERHVLLAEDSGTIRAAIESNLRKAGYAHVTVCPDGSEAWSTLEASLLDKDAKPFTVVVTDIEMPQMDGLHLCKRVKEHPGLEHLPVIVFSSLVSDSNLQKCKSVGADAAITKPQMGKLVSLLDQLLETGTHEGNLTEEEMLIEAG